MSTLFTDHYLVQTTPKRVFKKFFLLCAYIPFLGLSMTFHTSYNDSRFTKSQWLGALLGTLLGALLVFLICVLNIIPLRFVLLAVYYVSLTVYAIVSKKRDKGNPDVKIKTHRTWGNNNF